MASQLMIKGADRAKIIESLYRTKNIDTLKSWGKILSRLHQNNNIVSSYLLHDESRSVPQDFQEMVNDLILATPQTQIVMILRQQTLERTEAWIYTRENINAIDLTQDFVAAGHRRFAKVVIDKDYKTARELLTAKLQTKLDFINLS